MINVLMVCTGNICRSPMAEGAFRNALEKAGLGQRISVDSAAMGAYHIGDPPDPRAQKTALKNKVDISMQRARLVQAEDFSHFHYIIAMDHGHLHRLKQLQPETSDAEVCLLAPFATNYTESEVDDPYYGDLTAFASAFALIDDAVHGLLSYIQSQQRNRL